MAKKKILFFVPHKENNFIDRDAARFTGIEPPQKKKDWIKKKLILAQSEPARDSSFDVFYFFYLFIFNYYKCEKEASR